MLSATQVIFAQLLTISGFKLPILERFNLKLRVQTFISLLKLLLLNLKSLTLIFLHLGRHFEPFKHVIKFMLLSFEWQISNSFH